MKLNDLYKSDAFLDHYGSWLDTRTMKFYPVQYQVHMNELYHLWKNGEIDLPFVEKDQIQTYNDFVKNGSLHRVLQTGLVRITHHNEILTIDGIREFIKKGWKRIAPILRYHTLVVIDVRAINPYEGGLIENHYRFDLREKSPGQITKVVIEW